MFYVCVEWSAIFPFFTHSRSAGLLYKKWQKKSYSVRQFYRYHQNAEYVLLVDAVMYRCKLIVRNEKSILLR